MARRFVLPAPSIGGLLVVSFQFTECKSRFWFDVIAVSNFDDFFLVVEVKARNREPTEY